MSASSAAMSGAMMETELETFADLLDDLERRIDKEFSRKLKDTHDYSSSSYSAFDDGYNTGIETATERFKELLLDQIKECPNCGHQLPFADGDYQCIFCRREAIENG